MKAHTGLVIMFIINSFSFNVLQIIASIYTPFHHGPARAHLTAVGERPRQSLVSNSWTYIPDRSAVSTSAWLVLPFPCPFSRKDDRGSRAAPLSIVGDRPCNSPGEA